MKSWTSILILCLCANVALGGVIVSAPDSGWYNQDWHEGEEYRWGATLRNMDHTNGDWELGIGNTTEMTEGGPSQENFNWNAGTTYSFDLSYNSTSEQAIWTVDGTSVVLQNPASSFTDMYIQLKGRPDTSQANMSIFNTTLSVEGIDIDIDDFAAGYGEVDDLRYIHLYESEGALCDMDFILAGKLNIDWSGEAPSRDAMGMHVKLSNFLDPSRIPEPASIVMVLMASVTGLFIRRRFR